MDAVIDPPGGLMRLLISTAVAAALLGSSACAMQPKPCTAEWFDWTTARFFDEFARDHRKDIDSLRDTTSRLTGGAEDKSLGNVATMGIAGVKAIGLAGSFLSDTVPAIKDAVGQCGSAPKAAQLFASLLRREGFDERAVKAVEDLGVMLDKDG